MKKNYLINKRVVLAFLLLFTVHLTSYAQTRSNSQKRSKPISGANVSRILAPQGGPISTVTACNSYTWPANGQTYTSSGIYNSTGITQGYNNQAAWQSNVTANNATVASNNLGGLTAANPIVVPVGATTVSLGATGGMYATATFVSSNTATDALTITFSPAVYGFSANIFGTNISDAVTPADITVTYSTGFVDARNVTSGAEFFGYTSTTPITSVTITAANTVAPFKWPTINNLSLATNPNATLDLTISTGPVTTNYSICQGGTVSGGLTSTLGGSLTSFPNFVGDNTGGPTYNRSLAMNQGGTCGLSAAGTAVQYVTQTYVAPVSGDYTFSTCGGATFDTFLALYQAPFTPPNGCVGNTLIESSDDVCGAQSTITATLVGGTTYVLVVSGFGNTQAGPFTVTSTTPPYSSVEWYTGPTGGTAIGTGSPFNPVGVAGSGLTDTNTVGTTPFYAQFPGDACRTVANFVVTPPTITPTFDPIAAICSGDTVSALPTTSTNGITGIWSPALDNTTTTTYTFTPSTGQCALSTTLTLTVNPLPTITCPGNITACEGETVNYTITSNVGGSPVTLTQNTSSVAVAAGGIACNPGGDNTFYRVYDLAALGYSDDLLLNNIKFSVQDNGADRDVTVSAYTLSGPLTNANLTLLGSTLVPITTAPLTDYTAAMGGLTVPGNSKLVVSYSVVSNASVLFNPGANAAGQTETGYIRSVDCGILEPVSFASVGFPNVHIIIDAELSTLGGLTLVTGLPSGSVFPVGTTTVTYMATNTNGCESTCSFDVTVNAPTAPTFTQVPSICVGGTLSPLPTTSNDGVTGTWSPAIDSTTTTTYTFTPDAGQCATTTTMTIAVNPLPTVAFTANPFPVCAGSNTILTANVTNATPTVTFGSQTLALTTAAFGTPLTTPLSGVLFDTASNGCTAFAPGSLTGKIALIQRGVCAFAIKAQNAQDAGAIAVILYNNVAGPIVPGGAAPGVTIPVYGASLADGQALITGMTASELNITITPPPVITYLWSNGSTIQTTDTGILNADTDFTVTVTNTGTGCTATITVTVPVTALTVPTFTQVADICSGGTLSPLPTTSDNGIAGTWSPALDNTATTTYTFTPTPVAGQCLGTATMTITVNTAAAPTGDAVQTITVSNPNDATISTIVINPSNSVWYGSLADAQSGTNPLPGSTVLVNGNTYYAVNVVGGCSSTPFGVTVNVTLGNEEFDDMNFIYSPNPTSSVLNISYSREISEVSVTNILGQNLFTKKTNSTEVQLDLSSLAEATYFVKVTSEGREKVVKVIKKD